MTTAQQTIELFKTSPRKAYELFKKDSSAIFQTYEEFVRIMAKMIDRRNESNQSENHHADLIEANY